MSNPLSIGKVVDPKDPLFDPMKFSFFDYSGVIELRSVIRQLFPVGTSKNKVDSVLIDAGDAWVRQIDFQSANIPMVKGGTSLHVYRFPGTNEYRKLMRWGPVSNVLIFYYDENLNVVSVADNYNHILGTEVKKD